MLKKNEPDWIEHDGSSECPVPAGHDVEVRFGDLVVERDTRPESWAWTWAKCDPQGLRLITHYRDWTAFEQQQTSAGEVPEWALERVYELWQDTSLLEAFARYIAAHEPKGEVPEWVAKIKAALPALEYCIDNPSAWDDFSQNGSDNLAVAARLLRTAIATYEPEPDALREVAEELARESQDLNLPLRKRVGWFEAQLRARGVTAPARGEG